MTDEQRRARVQHVLEQHQVFVADLAKIRAAYAKPLRREVLSPRPPPRRYDPRDDYDHDLDERTPTFYEVMGWATLVVMLLALFAVLFLPATRPPNQPPPQVQETCR